MGMGDNDSVDGLTPVDSATANVEVLRLMREAKVLFDAGANHMDPFLLAVAGFMLNTLVMNLLDNMNDEARGAMLSQLKGNGKAGTLVARSVLSVYSRDEIGQELSTAIEVLSRTEN